MALEVFLGGGYKRKFGFIDAKNKAKQSQRPIREKEDIERVSKNAQ